MGQQCNFYFNTEQYEPVVIMPYIFRNAI